MGEGTGGVDRLPSPPGRGVGGVDVSQIESIPMLQVYSHLLTLSPLLGEREPDLG